MKGYVWLDLLASSDLKGAPKAVGYALAHFAGGNGVAWPSYDTLARAAGVSRRAAIDAIAVLWHKGYINIVGRAKANGASDSNMYLLTQPTEGQVVNLLHQVVQTDHHLERGGSELPAPKLLTKEPLTSNHGFEGLLNAQSKRWSV